jgi:hypothetical protein
MFNTDQALDFISKTRVNTTQYKQSRQSPLEMNRSGFLRAVIANYWVITLFNNAINKYIGDIVYIMIYKKIY